MKNKSHIRFLHTAIAVLLLVVITMELFQIKDNFQIGTLLLIAALFVICPLPFKQWTFMDWMLSIIVLYDLISCFYGSCIIPAVRNMLFSLFGFIAYLLLRRLLSSNKCFIQVLQTGSYFPIGIALALAVCSFFMFRNSVLGAGFADTYSFRFLFRPLGYMTNVWAEVLLILLGWLCMIRRYAIPFIFFTVFAILLSFSRGAYIALCIYLVIWMIANFRTKKWKSLFAVLIAIAITAVFFPAEIKTTLQMNATASQQRSYEWRVDATRVAWKVFKEHPVVGYGNGNYTFAIDRSMNQDSTLPYTSLAPNIIVKLLVEKGVIGTIPYLLLVIGVCRLMLRYRKETDTWIIAAVLLALAAKEMTQSIVFNAPFVWLMVYILLAFLQQRDTNPEIKKTKMEAKRYLIPGLALAIYAGGVLFCRLAAQGYRFPGNKTSCLVQDGMDYARDYRETHDNIYAEKAILSFKEAQKSNPKDVQIIYLLARMYLQKGEIVQGCFLLDRLTSDYPKNSLYSWTLGNAYYRKKMKKKALSNLVNAILYTPRLLTMKQVKEWEKNDSSFYQALRQELRACPVDSLQQSPSDLARYGYIMYWLGERLLAEKVLRKSVEVLPNLATPWHLLREEKKYRLLQLGAFRKKLFSSPLPAEQAMTDELMLDIAYKTKYYEWYGREFEQ